MNVNGNKIMNIKVEEIRNETGSEIISIVIGIFMKLECSRC